MATLSDVYILDALDRNELVIDPVDYNCIQPGSIDLKLGEIIEVPDPEKDEFLDVTCEKFEKGLITKNIKDGYDLKPGEFVVGHSLEHIELPRNINGEILNRNSLAVIGLNAAISQYINPGFSGNKIIVVQNMSHRPICIQAGMRICQLVLFKMLSGSMRDYESRHSLKQFGNRISAEEKEYLDSSASKFMNDLIKRVATKSYESR